MSINISVHGSPVSIRRKKLVFSDVETLKKNEINRRRRLRLEQVRQQSKDIANEIRQRVKGERDKHQSSLEDKHRAELNKQRAQRLLQLQQQYQDCLEEIGMGHLGATLEPDPEIILEAEREKNRALAEERGKEARSKLRKDLAEAEEKKNAARKQQEFSRTVENLRSAVIASLGKSLKRTPKKRKGKKKKKKPLSEMSDSVAAEQQTTCPSSSYLWTVPFDKDVELHGTEADFKQTTVPTALVESEESETFESSSEDNLATSGSSSISCSSSLRATDLQVQQSRVRFYDHGNRHKTEYESCTLVERIDPCAEPNANDVAEIESQKSPGAEIGPATYTRTYDRGNQAMARERLHRDYKQLLEDLHILAREERLIRSTREHGLPPEVFYEDYRRKQLDNRRQRNMDSAFESIYHRTQMNSPSVLDSLPDTISTEPQWVPAEQDNMPAKLNVADYRESSPVAMLNVHSAVAESGVSISHAPTSSDTVEQAGSMRGPVNIVTLGGTTTATSATPDISTSITDRKGTGNFTDPEQHFSLATGQATSTEPEPSVYRNDSLEELMEKVKAQQALLLDEIKLSSEAPEPVQEQRDSRDLSSHRPPDHKEKILGASQEVVGAEEKVVKLQDSKNGLESKVEAVRQGAKGNIEEEKYVKVIKPHTVCKCKEREERRKEENSPKKVDKVICKSDSDTQLTEIHSEYSYEHSVVDSNSVSGSTSYEGVKIVVSVSELLEKMSRPTQNTKGKKIVSVKMPQKIVKHHEEIRKICKRRHKTPEGLLIGSEGESHIDKNSPRKLRKQEKISTDVRNKSTMTADCQLPLTDRNKSRSNIAHERKSSDEKVSDHRIGEDKSWRAVLEKSTSSKKDSSESTTYMSPPEELVSSNIEHLASLLATVKKHQEKKDVKAHNMNPLLVYYITRLLAMSRESIEHLGVSTSDISTPDIESSSGENVQLYYGRPKSSQDRIEDTTDTLVRNVRGKTETLICPCKPPCSGLSQNVPGTSTPQEDDADVQKQKGTETAHHLDISTPHFKSTLKDVSLEKYKTIKFPDIFPEYSERCSRISNLAKRIELIRNEQKRLMSNISASSSSSSGSGHDYDSTKYISPPESITIMTRLNRKESLTKTATGTNGGKENIPPQIPCSSAQFRNKSHSLGHNGMMESGGRGTQYQWPSNNGVVQSSHSIYITPPESRTDTVNDHNGFSNQMSVSTEVPISGSSHIPISSNHDRTSSQPLSAVNHVSQNMPASGNYLQGLCGLCPQENGRRCDPNRCLISREPRPHLRPPSSSVRRNFQSYTDNVPVKELSTIIEGDTTHTSIGSIKDKEHPEDSSDESMPDALSEMLRRRLITSPSCLQTLEDKSSSQSPETSRNVQNSNTTNGFMEANFFTYFGQKTEELSQVLGKGFRNMNKLDLPRLIINVFSKLGKDPSEIEIDQAFKTIGLRWFQNDENQIEHTMYPLRHIDLSTKHFRDLVYKFFKGLTLDSPRQELENAFRKIGLVNPNASLRRNSNGRSVSFSSSTVGNSSDNYSASTSTGSSLLPPIPTSVSVSTEDLFLSQDMDNLPEDN